MAKEKNTDSKKLHKEIHELQKEVHEIYVKLKEIHAENESFLREFDNKFEQTNEEGS